MPRLLTFQKMLGALASAEYDRAAAEALDSKWAFQIGHRANEIAEMYRTGEWT